MKEHLHAVNEGWEVWTDWYDAVLEGHALDLDLELKRVLVPDEFWQQGPAAVNAEIARLIAEHHANRPQGETLEYDPASNQVGLSPAPVEGADALANAVSQVEDTLQDFKVSSIANRAYELNPVVQRLDRMLEKYRDNPRRVHDDLVRAARDVARAIEADAEIDAIPTRDLRDVCGQGAIDIRIAVAAVSEMEADRRRRIARQPSKNAQSAAQRLLAEIGEGLTQGLLGEIEEDVETVAASGIEDGNELPDSAARDAMLRVTARFGWIHQFARMSSDRIVALAQTTGKAVDDVERLVTLLRGAEGWWGVIEWLMRVVGGP